LPTDYFTVEIEKKSNNRAMKNDKGTKIGDIPGFRELFIPLS
jgi:hypothetical protein